MVTPTTSVTLIWKAGIMTSSSAEAPTAAHGRGSPRSRRGRTANQATVTATTPKRIAITRSWRLPAVGWLTQPHGP